ncbi:MAG: Crp/Fnr family transcriptional regulator [Saprospiraceae bacterium]|nr:Crp/Fnr family transcriptional regulator [Saprospiraceae bacterium]
MQEIEKTIKQILKATTLNKLETLDLMALGKEKTIRRKTLLLSPNRVADKAYFLMGGTIRHYTQNKNEQFTKNLIRGPRFMLPSLTSFFLGTPSTIYCESLTVLEVIEWDKKDLTTFADDHPKMYKFLLRGVVNAFRGKEEKEIAFITQNAEQRYLHFLSAYPNLINEIPIQYVASFLGIRPETLSRIRAKRIS